MSRDDDMPLQADQARLWTLAEDRLTVRLQLPPLPLEGIPEPVKVHLDFDAETVDEILLRLSALRARVLPPPRSVEARAVERKRP
jgi:hypothetical protein